MDDKEGPGAVEISDCGRTLKRRGQEKGSRGFSGYAPYKKKFGKKKQRGKAYSPAK